MLVLSRHLGESITIDGKTTVTIHTIGRNRVRLAFAAARDVQIVRSELLHPVDLSECPPLEDEPPTYRPVLRCRVCREPVSIDDSYPLVYGGFAHNDCVSAAEHERDREQEGQS